MHNSDIVNYSSSLRAKEDNLNDVCFESSKPAVVNNGQGSQHSNNVKTKVEPSSMHRETVASTIRVAPASSKSSSGGSGGSSNPTSTHLKAEFIYVKKEIPKEDRIWTLIPGCPRCKKDSFETRISKCVTNMVRHHDQDERETDGAMHWDVILPVLKGRFRNQLEKEFTEEDWLHCLYLGNIKTRFEICKDENGELRCDPRSLRWNDHITQTDELRDDSLHMEAIYLSRGSSTRPILHCRNWISGRKKGTQGRKTNNLLHSSWSFQQRCRWSRIHDRYYEAKKSTMSNSLETWTRCRVSYSYVHSTRCWSRMLTNRFQCHYHVPLCAKRMRRKGCQRKWEKRIVRKTAHTSRTRVHTRSNTVSMPREIESNLRAWKSDPNASEQVQKLVTTEEILKDDSP